MLGSAAFARTVADRSHICRSTLDSMRAQLKLDIIVKKRQLQFATVSGVLFRERGWALDCWRNGAGR